MRFSLFKTGDIIDSENYKACKAILAYQGITVLEFVDQRLVMAYSKGKINPSNGFVVVVEPGVAVTDCIQLVRWLDKKGLVRLS